MEFTGSHIVRLSHILAIPQTSEDLPVWVTACWVCFSHVSLFSIKENPTYLQLVFTQCVTQTIVGAEVDWKLSMAPVGLVQVVFGSSRSC